MLERLVGGAAVVVCGFLVACDVVWPEERGDWAPPDGGGAEAAPEAAPPSALDAGSGDAGSSPTVDSGASDALREELPLAAGDHALQLVHAGLERRFLVHVPSSYDATRAAPLVFDFHGFSSSAEAQKSISGWLAKADERGIVLVHPQGVANSWNGGSLCCGEALARGIDDVGFVRALLEQLANRLSIDRTRVYATGLSNGGAMAHRLACHASDVFAAVAPVSMSNGTLPCSPPRGISVFMFRATGDALVPYDSGRMFPTAAADFEGWRVQNGCLGEVAHEGPCASYAQCRDGSEVNLCTITTTAQDAPWGGHVLYPQALREGISVPNAAWQMFERHVLPR